MILGGICGYALGKAMIRIVNHIKLDIDGLNPELILALVFFTFTSLISLEATAPRCLYRRDHTGNSNFLHKKSMMRFYDGQAWLMQIVMFLTLGLLVYPSQIVPVIGPGVLISLFLIFVARPIAVMISLAFFRDLNIRKKLFVSWVGLRGAVPIIFSTYPLIAGIATANNIFNLVFFISASSILLQGNDAVNGGQMASRERAGKT